MINRRPRQGRADGEGGGRVSSDVARLDVEIVHLLDEAPPRPLQGGGGGGDSHTFGF